MAQDLRSARISQAVGPISLQSVRCLDCNTEYGKPSGGGTLTRNPGCPACGYVGWLSITDEGEVSPRGRSAADHRQRLRAIAG
jgi:hypothetical protein